MKRTDNTLNALVDMAVRDGHDENSRPVIQKELLHYDILFYLKQSGLLNDLVFQGGTSLRLCYGSARYSEDLDFVGGRDFSSSSLTELKSLIEEYLSERYGLEVTVKEPATLKAEEPAHAALNVDKWQVSVVTEPGRPDLPRQRIKIEVANIPAYTCEDLQLNANYRFLPDGYKTVRIGVEAMDEIMADKLVALAASQKYVRYRDIWDLVWLKQMGCTVRPDLVECKIEDYGETDYQAQLDRIIDQAPSLIADGAFGRQMRRFLLRETYNRAFGEPGYEQRVTQSITGMYKELRSRLYSSPVEDVSYSL